MAEPDISYAGDNVAPFLVADAGPPRVPVITVRPKPKGPPPAADKPPTEGTGLKSIEDQPDYVDKSVPKAAPGGGSIEDQPDYVDKSVPMQPEREVSFGQAVGAGIRGGPTFGFEPVMQGLKAAGQAEGGGLVDQIAGHIASGTDMNPLALISKAIGLPSNSEIVQGIARIAMDKVQGTTQATQAYTQGRDTALETNELAAKQHPGGYYPGLVASSLAVPVGGGAAAATRLGNVARTAGTGAALGGVQGIGEGVSQGQDLPGVLASGTKGAIAGFGAGGAIGAVLPRAAAAVTAGQRAAQTAAGLGAPLPRGVASDIPFIQRSTSAARQVPIAGSRISHAVERTEHAAGERIEGIAGGLTQGSRSRAVADTVVREGIDHAIEANRTKADTLYKGVRGLIDQNAHFTMPRTKAVLAEIEAQRAASGTKPNKLREGLEEVYNLVDGATFNGAHERRYLTREAGGSREPHPGYNAKQFNRVVKAMTADLKGMVAAGAKNQTQQGRQAAVDAFNDAEQKFGPIAEANKSLNKIARGQGESAIARLLDAAGEEGGNVRLLAELKRNMSPDAFEHLGGQLLHELGASPKRGGEFSLDKFVTEWGKLSERGRNILFSPQHRADLENIFQMGQHIKGALKESSTSHSANLFVAFEMLKELGTAAAELYAGGHGGYAAASAATTGGIYSMAHWLGNPAQARSISNWATAYRAATLGAPTPARIAALKIASRNLAHNLNIPVEDVMRTMQKHTPASAEEQPQDNRPQVPQSR